MSIKRFGEPISDSLIETSVNKIKDSYSGQKFYKKESISILCGLAMNSVFVITNIYEVLICLLVNHISELTVEEIKAEITC